MDPKADNELVKTLDLGDYEEVTCSSESDDDDCQDSFRDQYNGGFYDDGMSTEKPSTSKPKPSTTTKPTTKQTKATEPIDKSKPSEPTKNPNTTQEEQPNQEPSKQPGSSQLPGTKQLIREPNKIEAIPVETNKTNATEQVKPKNKPGASKKRGQNKRKKRRTEKQKQKRNKKRAAKQQLKRRLKRQIAKWPMKVREVYGTQKVFSSSGSGNKMGLSVVLYHNRESFDFKHHIHDGFKVGSFEST